MQGQFFRSAIFTNDFCFILSRLHLYFLLQACIMINLVQNLEQFGNNSIMFYSKEAFGLGHLFNQTLVQGQSHAAPGLFSDKFVCGAESTSLL